MTPLLPAKLLLALALLRARLAVQRQLLQARAARLLGLRRQLALSAAQSHLSQLQGQQELQAQGRRHLLQLGQALHLQLEQRSQGQRPWQGLQGQDSPLGLALLLLLGLLLEQLQGQGERRVQWPRLAGRLLCPLLLVQGLQGLQGLQGPQ